MLGYTVQKIPSHQSYDWLLKKHYAGSIPSIISTYGLMRDHQLYGVCCFGTPANNHNNTLGEFRCIELVRLVIDEKCEKNTLSFFVSQALNQLEKPCVVISYADEGFNHHGYIYQATNWIYTGKGGGVDFYRDTSGKMIHSRIMSDYRLKYPTMTRDEIMTMLKWTKEKGTYKHRYFYFLGDKKQKKEMMKQLLEKYKVHQYPKGDNTRYDSTYQPSIQKSLF